MWPWNYEKSIHKSTEVEREKLEKKTYQFECPVSVELQWPVEMSQILMVLSSLPLATSLPSGEKATELTLWLRQVSTWNTQAHRKTIKKKHTCLSARSGSTGNLQIASPKSWWFCHYYRWQFAFHRDSTTQTRPWNYEKSIHKSTEAEREKLEKNLPIRVPGHRRLGKVNFEFFTFLYFQNVFIKKCYVFEWPVSWTLTHEHKICIIFVWHID